MSMAMASMSAASRIVCQTFNFFVIIFFSPLIELN
jgi:hypothetical protein